MVTLPLSMLVLIHHLLLGVSKKTLLATKRPHNQTMSESSSSQSADEAMTRSLYQQSLDGLNTGNGEAFAVPHAEDGDLVGFDGTHLKGRQEIATFHQQLFDTYVKGSRLVGKIKDVRFLTPGVALMHVVDGTIMAGQTDIDPKRNSIRTLVAMYYIAKSYR
jgi:uncharacterized protein (TIGR02246 family)